MVYLLFKGARFEFLMEQLAAYNTAVTSGTTKEFLDVVYARFARRFPIDLPLSEDPSPEFLESVDDSAPEPESEIRINDLSPEELEIETKRVSDRQAAIQKRRKQIGAWFHYRHMKQHSVDPRSTDPSNPFTALLFSVTGIHPAEKPRQKSAVNCWSKSQTATINQLVRQSCVANNVGRKNSMAVWNKIAKEEFSKLPQDKQRYWEQKAKDDHAKDIEQWKTTKEAAISTKPEDRQRCIEGIVRLGQEFLDKLAEATGWKWTLLGGGPEPVSEGRLTVISLHGGTTNGEVKLNFGQKERELYISQILPVFSKFLRGCYTPEECRSRALNAEDIIPLEDSGLEDLGISYDVLSPSAPAHNARTSPPPVYSPSLPSIPAQTSNETTLVPLDPVAATVPGVGAKEQDHRPEAVTQHRGNALSPPPSVAPTPLGTPVHSPSRRGRSISSSPSSSTSDLPPTTAELPANTVAASSTPSTNTVAASSMSSANTVAASSTPSTTTAPDDVTENGSSHTSTIGRKRQPPVAPDSPPSKRARRALSTTSVPSRLSETPWFTKALDMLDNDALGQEWQHLIQTWIRFEEASADNVKGSVPAKGRPSAVGDWIQRARNSRYRPVIKDSKEFGTKHVAWWRGLQPAWRIPSNDDLELPCEDGTLANDDSKFICDDDGDFEDLRKPGVNGLLSVLASLYFWGLAVKDSRKKSKRWDQCVADCMYVLRRLSDTV